MMGGRTVKGTPFVFWLVLAGFEANSARRYLVFNTRAQVTKIPSGKIPSGETVGGINWLTP